MDGAPMVVVADADVLHQALAFRGFLHGQRQGKRTVGRIDDTSVAVGLLLVVVVLLHPHPFVAIEFGEPLHWRQVARGEQTVHFGVFT